MYYKLDHGVSEFLGDNFLTSEYNALNILDQFDRALFWYLIPKIIHDPISIKTLGSSLTTWL